MPKSKLNIGDHVRYQNRACYSMPAANDGDEGTIVDMDGSEPTVDFGYKTTMVDPGNLELIGPAELDPMTITLRQLKDARNELKTLSYEEIACIIHGLRRVQQHDPADNKETATALLARLVR